MADITSPEFQRMGAPDPGLSVLILIRSGVVLVRNLAGLPNRLEAADHVARQAPGSVVDIQVGDSQLVSQRTRLPRPKSVLPSGTDYSQTDFIDDAWTKNFGVVNTCRPVL